MITIYLKRWGSELEALRCMAQMQFDGLDCQVNYQTDNPEAYTCDTERERDVMANWLDN